MNFDEIDTMVQQKVEIENLMVKPRYLLRAH